MHSRKVTSVLLKPHTSYLRTLALGVLVAAYAFPFAYTAHAAESIPSFDARITVSANATVEVAEAITYDFGGAQRHGIFRVIPYSYQAGTETYTADISSVTVTDSVGTPWPFEESRSGGELTLKVGDPDSFVTGLQTYVITYLVQGPFLYFDDRDEFYWNVTGVWPNAIEKASVLVDLPYGAAVIDAACYQGKVGSTQKCTSDERLVSEERAGYSATAQTLAAEEGFTVAVAFPKGTIAAVEKPWSGERPPYHLWILSALLPLVTFVAMGYLWYTRGRDPKGKGTIVPEYEPPAGVAPSIAGTLYNERVDMRDLTAEIVELAVGGHLRIHRIETKVLLIIPDTDYLLERRERVEGTAQAPLGPIGALLLEKLFESAFMGEHEINGQMVRGALLSKMKHAWMQQKKALEERVYDETVLAGYFLKPPQKVRLWWVLGGAGFAFLGFFATSFVGVGATASGIIIATWGYFMPAKTALGVLVHEQIEGFRRYLSVAEKDRLEFHNAPEKTPELFDRYLPYAIALGVEKQWAEQFADLALTERTWYAGSPGTTFAASVLASDLASFANNFAAAAAPKSSGSGGGGFSGGGFGGGGGGSW